MTAMPDRRDRFEALLARPWVLLDGGLGTTLIAGGLPVGQAPERWVVERPDRVAAAHRAFVEAGSDVVQAATFGANPVRLAACGLEGRCREINLAAVRLAREAAGPGVLVAGDVGPTGAPPAPEVWEAAFREQCDALAEAGADLVSVETFWDAREAVAAVRAAAAAGLPVLASMTFEERRGRFVTHVGDPLGASLRALRDAGAVAVGMNCGVRADVMAGMVREAVVEVEVPVVAQPNAGLPRALPGGGFAYDETPGAFARGAVALARAGARVLGGCCGADAAFIRAARAALVEASQA